VGEGAIKSSEMGIFEFLNLFFMKIVVLFFLVMSFVVSGRDVEVRVTDPAPYATHY
jgi:hypothetical protein